METAAATAGLSKLDLQAIRQCDRITFATMNGESVIRCVKEMEKRGPFGESERRHEIAVSARMTDYGRNKWANATDELHAYTCHESISNYKHSETVIRTVAQLLRIGDELKLSWVRNNDSTNIENAGLNVDELQLIVNRGKHRLLFHLSTSVCPNNTARMIRR